MADCCSIIGLERCVRNERGQVCSHGFGVVIIHCGRQLNDIFNAVLFDCQSMVHFNDVCFMVGLETMAFCRQDIAMGLPCWKLLVSVVNGTEEKVNVKRNLQTSC